MLAGGCGAPEVARACGVTDSTIYRWRNKEEIRKLIEEQTAQMMAAAPKAVDTYRRVLDDAAAVEVVPHLVEYEVDDPDKPGETKKVMIPADPKVIANNVKLLSIARETARDILQTAGILAAPSESRMILNIFSGDAARILSPLVGSILGALGPASPEPDAIDAEYEEVDENPESGE